MNALVGVGCDGTPVNTGLKGGTIRLLEESLNHPLHWFICMLHSNELPLRHLLITIDGKTYGPRGFTGSIGKQLVTCEQLPIAFFELVPAILESVDVSDLNSDQRYLYEMHHSVSQ